MAHCLKIAFVLALLTTGAVAAEQPSSTSASYGDWLLRCRTATVGSAENDASDPKAANPGETIKLCELSHTISVMAQTTEGAPAGQPVLLAQIAIGKPQGNDALKAIIRAPANVWLREPVIIQLGDSPEALPKANGAAKITASYFICQGNACLADTALSAANMKALGAAKAAQMQFTDGSGRTVNIPLSLNGFAAAAAALAAE